LKNGQLRPCVNIKANLTPAIALLIPIWRVCSAMKRTGATPVILPPHPCGPAVLLPTLDSDVIHLRRLVGLGEKVLFAVG
jgi:hypothetical protein